MEKQVNYTEAQEAMIREAAADGPLNLEKATALASAMGKKPRSIIAKAVRMDLPYAKRVPTTKTGEPITRKETLVEKIAEYVAGDLSGLEKASKPALQNVLAALALANAED
jgi:hypothetical protein